MKPLRRIAVSLPLILIVALALRAGFAWSYQARYPHGALGAIPFLFESGNIAHSIATGGGFASPFRIDTGPTAWMTPLYPYLLAAIMKAFGPYTFQSWVAAVAVNIVFSCLVCIPLFFSAKRIGGIGLAAGAAWLWAIFPNAIQMTYQSLWDTSVSAFLATLIFWSTLRLHESRTARPWVFYGLLWGVALMTNASLLSLLPFLLGWAVISQAFNRASMDPCSAKTDESQVAQAFSLCEVKQSRAQLINAFARPSSVRTIRRAALSLAIIALCCIPWTIRNFETFHAIIPLRSVLGLQLWCGNNPDAKVVWLGGNHPIHDQAERDRYIQMGEIPYMREKEQNALRYIFTHPAREAQLIAGRFVMIWTAGTPTPITDLLQSKSAWFRYVLLFNIAVAFGTMAGVIILFIRHSPYAFPACVYPLVFPWAYYLTLALPRYRHPIEPVLVLLTAVAIASGVEQLGLRLRSRRAFATAEVVVHGRGHDQR